MILDAKLAKWLASWQRHEEKEITIPLDEILSLSSLLQDRGIINTGFSI